MVGKLRVNLGINARPSSECGQRGGQKGAREQRWKWRHSAPVRRSTPVRPAETGGGTHSMSFLSKQIAGQGSGAYVRKPGAKRCSVQHILGDHLSRSAHHGICVKRSTLPMGGHPRKGPSNRRAVRFTIHDSRSRDRSAESKSIGRIENVNVRGGDS